MDRLTYMEAFVRVVDAGGFSAAARSWGRSTAAVSKSIRALEAHLGVELLRRSTRAIHLTDAGHQYHARCVELLEAVDALESNLRQEHRAPRGVLRLTAPPGLMDRKHDAILTGFRRRYPEVRVDLRLTHRMVDMIEEGLDLAIRVTTPPDSSLIARRLAPAPMVLAASPDYLKREGRPSSPLDLRNMDCLVDTNFRDGAKWRFERSGRIETVEVDGPFRVDSPILVEALCRAGHGLALLPEFVARPGLAEGALVPLDIGRPAFDWSVYAVFPQRRLLSARVRVFVEHLAEVLAEDPPVQDAR